MNVSLGPKEHRCQLVVCSNQFWQQSESASWGFPLYVAIKTRKKIPTWGFMNTWGCSSSCRSWSWSGIVVGAQPIPIYLGDIPIPTITPPSSGSSLGDNPWQSDNHFHPPGKSYPLVTNSYGKPPFSYGFPMVFLCFPTYPPWKLPASPRAAPLLAALRRASFVALFKVKGRRSISLHLGGVFSSKIKRWLVVTGTWLSCFHRLGIIIPIYFYIFRRGRYTTNQQRLGWVCLKISEHAINIYKW